MSTWRTLGIILFWTFVTIFFIWVVSYVPGEGSEVVSVSLAKTNETGIMDVNYEVHLTDSGCSVTVSCGGVDYSKIFAAEGNYKDTFKIWVKENKTEDIKFTVRNRKDTILQEFYYKVPISGAGDK